ncbi:MAG: MFS transporter [Chloroflexi bacterium]|nr:MFS transporter [Chloroflexota bacterium]
MTTGENTGAKFFYGYIIVAISLFILAVSEGILYSFGIFLKPLAAEFGWTRGETAGAFSVFMVVNGLLFIPTGKLNDRFGPRLVITACSFILGLGYVLMSRLNALWQLYLFYGVVIALAESGWWVPLPSTVARWFVRRRGMMTGITVSGVGLGVLVMSPIISQLIASYGWRTSYLIVGLAALILIVSVGQLMKRDPGQLGLEAYGAHQAGITTASFQIEGVSLSRALRTGQLWMLAGIYFCFGFGLLVIMTHIVPYATDLGVSATIAATILAVIGGVSIAGRVGIGGISDKIGNRRSLAVCFALMSLALFWLMAAAELWMLYLFAVVFGFTYGGLAVLGSPTVAELFGMRAHGAILGAIMFVNYSAAGIGTFLPGYIFDVTGSYQPAFLLSALVGLAGLVLTSLLRPVKDKPLPPV